MNNNLSSASKFMTLIGAIGLVISLFVPLWRIELDAPQYPEGLALQIFPNKIAGDVEIINGLNHYIGMKTLHTEDFIEFAILPYIIGFFALIIMLNWFINKKKYLYFTLILFLIFGIISMIDFYRWNYDYGHNLDPSAAIIVPGMAYQPPIIGFKQLLNFGAYSIPDIGGWLFIGCGLLLLIASWKESGLLRFGKRKLVSPILLFTIITVFFFMSCNSNHPEPINVNKDKCEFCKMAISDIRFACELLTEKGRVYKFDDILCLNGYQVANDQTTKKSMWVSDFESTKLIDVNKAFYIESEELRSPMGGDLAAFSERKSAELFADKFQARIIMWDIVKNK